MITVMTQPTHRRNVGNQELPTSRVATRPQRTPFSSQRTSRPWRPFYKLRAHVSSYGRSGLRAHTAVLPYSG
jgi:acyl transferase domain-containing protein